MLTEQFKPIKGYEDFYEVSNYGRVKSLARSWTSGLGLLVKKDELILKNNVDKRGYGLVRLSVNGERKTHKVHQLVWDAFGDKPRDGRRLQVDHKNENKIDNYIGNLQLLTNRENCSKGKLQYNKSSRYTGVTQRADKWIAQIQINKEAIHLGMFDNEYKAHLAYQKALSSL